MSFRIGICAHLRSVAALIAAGHETSFIFNYFESGISAEGRWKIACCVKTNCFAFASAPWRVMVISQTGVDGGD